MNRSVDLGEADPRSYVRLAARIRKQIMSGDLLSGRPVPSITTLSQELGHARQTCGKAMQLLEGEGLLTRIPGHGYFDAHLKRDVAPGDIVWRRGQRPGRRSRSVSRRSPGGVLSSAARGAIDAVRRLRVRRRSAARTGGAWPRA